MNKLTPILLATAMAVAAPTSQADFVGWHAEATVVEDGGLDYCIVNFFAEFDSPANVLLYVLYSDVQFVDATFSDVVQLNFGPPNWSPDLPASPLDSYVRIDRKSVV